MIFLVVLFVLLGIGLLIFILSKNALVTPDDASFRKVYNKYLPVYLLASFSDWLQGAYVYKLYSDYGYAEEDIAILYIAGFASSSVFGTVVGHVADKYGRKSVCISFGFIYSLCCMTKVFSEFEVLLIGRVLGGISTSILCSTFDAWYINEHINNLELPPEWLSVTFGKASLYSGLLAILAGIISQVLAETFKLGSVSPFILAIAFLTLCSCLIWSSWEEHPCPRCYDKQRFLVPLYLIFVKDPLLLILGLIQTLHEAVMYTFIYSYTPILSVIDPPLGIVFASFMLAFMIGSMIYNLLLSARFPPQHILLLLSLISFISLSVICAMITYIYIAEDNSASLVILVQICFISFVVYEVCMGLYLPAISYLKGRVIPEEFRTSIANWFRMPMNILTCFSLTINYLDKPDINDLSLTITIFKKFSRIYILCSSFLLVATMASVFFTYKYTKRFSIEEPHLSSDSKDKKGVKDQDVKNKDVKDGEDCNKNSAASS